MSTKTLFVIAIGAILLPSSPGDASDLLEFSSATILTPANSADLETRSVQVLKEEIQKRTGLELAVATRWPGGPGPIIVVGIREGLPALHASLEFLRDAPAPGAEGFTVTVRGGSPPIVVVAGEDPRGVLYGVGRLLRKAIWSPGRVLIPSELQISTAPKYPFRGHQLGNRDVNNTYEAWTPEQWDAYIRDLALFGANSIEIIPPFTADFPTGGRSNRVLPSDEMMPHIIDAIDSYGMDVWVFYANVEEGVDEWIDPGDEGFTDPAFVQKMLDERERRFGEMKRLDHVLIPGGDPGEMSPEVLFPWLEKLAPVLLKHHPDAKIWISHQFGVADPAVYDVFFEHINRKPDWLGGPVFSVWGKTSAAEMRRRVDPSLPILRYPDITHSLVCQYPVLRYDRALALTLGREPPNPRPRAFKRIHNLFDEYAVGSIAYSEGVNDDLNKFVWLDQDWDPETPVVETVRDYARVFIDPRHTEGLALGFFALEENLNGVLAENRQIETTLQQWKALEAAATPDVLSNWRFQMPLLRAYYDALIKMRLFQARDLESRARLALARAPEDGALVALDRAEGLLNAPRTEPVGQEYAVRCLELADRLRENIRIQLSVERHGAVRQDRAAIIDGMEDPLNDAPYLLDRMEEARQLGEETERREAIEAILNRTNPGPGGFYDDFGSEASLRRVVSPPQNWDSDPGNLASIRRGFEYGGRWTHEGRPTPLAWFSHLSSLFGQPLSVRYDNLDSDASYRIRVVHGRLRPRPRLEADGHLIYDFGDAPENPVLEHPVPVEATRDGEVTFTWTPGPRSARAPVAELWLMRGDDNAEMPAHEYSGPREKLHMYLLIGQSNMAGRAAIPDEDKRPMEGCFLLDQENRWQPASNPLNRYSTILGSLERQRLNPGYMFAKTMRKNDPNISIGLISNARGATAIEEWMPGTQYYREAIKRVKAAWDTGVFKGVLWHQGEGNDADTDYHVKLKKLIAQMRKDLGNENMFFVAGGIVDSEEYPRGRIINPQMARLPSEVPFTGFASSEGLETFDRAHFRAEDMKILGRRYAEAVIELEKMAKADKN
jgi:hypothetical protein